MLTMQEQREQNDMIESWRAPGDSASFAQLVSEATQAFDPHALAMALQLATMLEDDDDTFAVNHYRPIKRWRWVSDWLRAEVQKELEAQP